MYKGLGSSIQSKEIHVLVDDVQWVALLSLIIPNFMSTQNPCSLSHAHSRFAGKILSSDEASSDNKQLND